MMTPVELWGYIVAGTVTVICVLTIIAVVAWPRRMREDEHATHWKNLSG
jgi:hypothetical protein